MLTRTSRQLAFLELEAELEKDAGVRLLGGAAKAGKGFIGRLLGGAAKAAPTAGGTAAKATGTVMPKALTGTQRAALIAEPTMPAASVARREARLAAQKAARTGPGGSTSVVPSRAGAGGGATVAARPPPIAAGGATVPGRPVPTGPGAPVTTTGLMPATGVTQATPEALSAATRVVPQALAAAPGRALPGSLRYGLAAGVPLGIASGVMMPGEHTASLNEEKLASLGAALSAARAGAGRLLGGALRTSAGRTTARFGKGALVAGGVAGTGTLAAKGFGEGTEARFVGPPPQQYGRPIQQRGGYA